VVASLLIRSALEARYGPSWGACTTQELSSRDELATALGDQEFEALIALLEASDRAKFGRVGGGPDGGTGDDPERVLGWLEALSPTSARRVRLLR
jgi:hypothetical protein